MLPQLSEGSLKSASNGLGDCSYLNAGYFHQNHVPIWPAVCRSGHSVPCMWPLVHEEAISVQDYRLFLLFCMKNPPCQRVGFFSSFFDIYVKRFL